MSHKFNRHIPPALPARRMLTRVSTAVPNVVDERRFCGPLCDQVNEGCCTGEAQHSAGEWIFRKHPIWLPKGSAPAPIFSPQYAYANELILNGDFPNDNGSDGTTACQVAVSKGFCPLSLYPFVPGQILQPTPGQDAAAAPYRMGAYHGVAGSKVALSVLGDPVPWPVLVGFQVYDSFESDQVATTGIYNPNTSTESVLGGHEVLMVGYDVGTTPTLRPANCPPAALIQNSWGPWGWNNSGFFWMALSVLDDPQTDLKVFHAGPPWK